MTEEAPEEFTPPVKSYLLMLTNFSHVMKEN